MKYLTLNDIGAYKRSLALSNYVWDVIIGWDYFAKQTVGSQFVRAIDSVSANLAEGFGRYKKLDKIHFYRISFGSMKEGLDWNEKSRIRKLLTQKQYDYILGELKSLPIEINQLIKFTRDKLQQ